MNAWSRAAPIAALALALALAGCGNPFAPRFEEAVRDRVANANIGVSSVDISETVDTGNKCTIIGVDLVMDGDTITSEQLETALSIIGPALDGRDRVCHIGLGARTADGERISVHPAADELGLDADDYYRNTFSIAFERDVVRRDFGN